MAYYETAEMHRDSRRLPAWIEEMRNLPDGTTVQENADGAKTIIYKDGGNVIRSKSSSTASRSGKSRATSELVASLKNTMRKTDENISDFVRRIAQLDAEISSETMRGQYTGHLKYQRDNLMQKINQLEAIKGRCAALLGGM